MALTVGTKLGPYQVVGLLGAGGMGEVYRTRDTKLGRDVAIKTLSHAFTSSPERLARFEREARLLATLNHPNICSIYGLEEADGIRYLILELVEGETLAERVAGKGQSSGPPLALGDTLAIARQLVGALEAAHEKDIVHRDLKPANIKITPDGTVKVLDFGIAKAVSIEASILDITQSPTFLLAGTGDGMILGTAAYMSPEQARGKTVDKRTDIWAFGCLVFEMLTGRVAFGGETTADIIGKILERDIDWSALPAATPTPIRRLLIRCLAKDPKQRLRDIGDVRFDIDEALAGATDATAAPSPIVPQRDVHFHRLTDFTGLKESPAISPDGKMVAFVALVNRRRQIWIRLLAGGVPLQVTRDETDHEQPRWAPDSSTIIYFGRPSSSGEEGGLWEIAALGGPPRLLASAIGGGDISHDGRRIAIFRSAGEQVELAVLTREGSHVQRVTLLRPDQSYFSPRWSPDDRWIGFLRSGSGGFDLGLETVSVADGEPREIARSETLRGFCWLPDGSGLVLSSSSGSTLLYPPAFNLRTIGRDGTAGRQLTFGDQSFRDPDAHQSGKLLACRVRSQSDIWRFPTSGSPAENTRDGVRITRQTGQAQTPSASPDGTEVVYLSDNGGHGNLWIAKTNGSDVRQITFERDLAVTIGVPMWSPAGNWITFIVTRRGYTGLWVIHPDGSGLREVVKGWSACWSRDGRWLYYTPTGEGPRHLEKMPVEGGTPIVVREEGGWGPAIAADGGTLHYVQWPRHDIFGRSGDAEIRSVRLDTGATQLLARIARRRIPVWPGMLQPFISPDDQWLAVPLIDGATSNLWVIPSGGGSMRRLTDFGDRAIVIARSVSWSADGQHLYAAVAENETDVVLLDGLIQ